MLHSVHLMFGSEFADTLKYLKSHILKYGEDDALSEIRMLLWEESSEGVLTFSSVQQRDAQTTDPFVSGIENQYETEMIEEGRFEPNRRDEYVAVFFEKLFNEMININTDGDSKSLHLYIYVPLYDEKVWKQAQNLLSILQCIHLSFHVDIIGLSSDMAFLFTPEEEIKTLPERRREYAQMVPLQTKAILNFKKDNPGSISHFLILQNNQQDGLSLQLDQESFVRLMGEFALLTASHYYSLFLPHAANSDEEVTAIGLSLLNFDKYYFVQYLLRRTYLHIMDREKVTETKVDISVATGITQEKLKDKTRLVSSFYDKEVLPLLQKKVDENEIIRQITPRLEELVKDLEKDFQSFLLDEKLSLPEKKATLATLLGQDDVLLGGYDFQDELLILDDIDQEAAQAFVDANNTLFHSLPEYAVLSKEGEIHIPLKRIKELRRKVRESTTYIRENEKQLETYRQHRVNADEAEKRLTKDGFFHFKGNNYRLIPKEIKEFPLEETYTPQTVKASGVDLREHFSHVKNQGAQGACSAFTLSAIYEYILKKNKALDEDLSEAFLYYNARKNRGNEKTDSGCSYLESIKALTEEGICIETLCPYDENKFDKKPSADAYADAEKRKVKTAKNVNVDLDDIKSALEEGYPVAVSVRLYDSFSADNSGFVSRPTEEELKAGEYGNHAMVICGFSEDKKIFIVRNSWGKSFGDNGYCYMPYSYIGDPSLVNMACIITEIGGDYKVITGEKNIQAFFNLSDNNIKYAILNNLVNEEKYKLQLLLRQEGILREHYYTIFANLRNNSVRSNITKGMSLWYEKKIEEYQEAQEKARTEKPSILDLFKKETRRMAIKLSLIILGIWCLLGILCYYLTISEVLSKKEAWGAIGVSLLLALVVWIYCLYRAHKKKLLQNDLENEIIRLGVEKKKYEKSLSELKLRMHINGMFLDKFHTLNDALQNKYHVMQSFVGNLCTWHEELKEEINEMDSSTKDPFISLLSNPVLDNYFEHHKQEIANDLSLSDFIKEYKITEKDIVVFQKKLKDSIVRSILHLVDDFTIFNHISKQMSYAFLDDTYADCKKLLPLLDDKSKVFLKLTPGAMAKTPHKVVFIHTKNESEESSWKKIYPNRFQLSPTSEDIASPNKVIVAHVLGLPSKDVDMKDFSSFVN
ncbi:C1 family peptidase [Parabacteroides sp. OttesenSCG-928-B22]|nr:C1 family peptidase [Parabacteroides sp. OttesenSCG-928-B22]